MSAAPALAALAPWTQQALTVGVAAARFAFAFALVPIFSPQVIPATVRNSLLVAFGLIALSLPHPFDPGSLDAGQWVWLYAKEAVAGTTIGFFFGTVMWAMGAAGEMIDAKVGATVGQLIDPMSGLQESITAGLLARVAQLVFVSAGGITLLVGTVMLSYAAWPLGPGDMAFDRGAVRLFEAEFGRLFALAFLFAAPVLLVLYVIDLGLGLLNRFAQQFNVFSLSMPIKAVAAVVVLIMLLPLFAGSVIRELGTRQRMATEVLSRVGSQR
ncbi:type III secretion system export apparatus subunit SctT [Sphingomonas sp. DT-51]|uniref:type III secretion system export apparatus subunit SctT n=1 Tax=Sphingomonas sp. DT-51 TaxID=3396165 RepID=UPI003F1AA8FD